MPGLSETEKIKPSAVKTQPTVSVIIPTFNRINYISNAITSVIEQTTPVHEIIIVDDGSSASTRQALQVMANQHPCVSLYHLPENKGVSSARNLALDSATSEYILFLDDDDWLNPQMIASTLKLLEKETTLSGVFCLYDYKNDITPSPTSLRLKLLLNYQKLKRISVSFKPIEYFSNEHLAAEPVYTFLRSTFANHSCLLRRTAVGKTRFPENLVFGEDKFFWLSLALKGCKFKIIPKIYSTLYRHSANHSRYSFKNEKKKQRVYYEALVREKMLPGRKNKVFIFLKLVHVRFVLGQSQRLNELAAIIMAPDMVFKELFFFCKRRVTLRWHFIRFYFQNK
ncbi:MAG: glycosyltransferase family 2 protein [Desulfobacteraceae bacterium]|nr:glycosyltransferase family 2 protein [Desulfobacteraceae bacterium]MBC2757858.1 glycosyltransferase family 2 protein [Desulfobacteraceae bacterium]